MNGLKLQQLIENLLSFSAWQAKSEVLTLSDFPLRALVISVAKEQPAGAESGWYPAAPRNRRHKCERGSRQNAHSAR